MGNYIKADHRLVQPLPRHYKQRQRKDGEIEDVLVGPYTIDQRDRFMNLHKELLKVRHPDIKGRTLKQNAFGRWRNLVFATIGDEYIPVTDIKKAKNVVKVFPKLKKPNQST